VNSAESEKGRAIPDLIVGHMAVRQWGFDVHIIAHIFLSPLHHRRYAGLFESVTRSLFIGYDAFFFLSH
jgi:hypothetical protein